MSVHEARQGFIHNYATAATIGLSVVVGVTGLMLLFHVAAGSVKGIHEWVGVAFVVASVLHVIRNGQAFCRLLVRARTLIVCGVILAGAGGLVVASSQAGVSGGDPMRAVAGLLTNASLAQVASLNHEPVDAMIARLGNSGIKGAEGSKPLSQVAAENGIDIRGLLGTVLAKGGSDAGRVSADTDSRSDRSAPRGS